MFKNLKLSVKLSFSVAISIIAFAIFFAISYNSITSTIHDSDTNYNSIMLSKDLVADILPPPLYIIESYLICNQIYFENDISKLNDYKQRLIGLNKDYGDRHLFWDKETSDKKIRKLLLEESYSPTIQFFTIIEKEYLPAIEANNKDNAIKILLERLKPLYEQHRTKIDELVAYANENNTKILTANKQSITDSVNTAVMILIIITIILISLIIISSLAISKSIAKQLGADPMDVQAIANKVAVGDLSSIIEIKTGDNSSLLHSMDQMSKSINGLVVEVNALSNAGVEGKLDVRADANKYNGEYRNLIKGLNNTLDAVIKPLNVTAEYVDRISKGDIPHIITDNYNGDFNNIKQNLNQCISAITLLISDSDSIYQAVKVGDLQLRPDRTKHQGDFRKVIDGITNTLDTIGIALVENVRVMTEMEKGNLGVRYEGKFLGAFAALQNTVNQTLEKLPLAETMEIMQELSQGNLTVKMNREYSGDSLKLKNAVNDTIDSLNEILGDVRSTVEEVTRAAMQVSDTSSALSQGATEQAASLEEITSSMSEIGSQTRHNAENANMANALAHEARSAAEKGNSEMGELTDAMTEINESSKNISKIIKVIDEIAFQTNLLALNAAEEAARAGRHGKGFAVVAEEVRNLAARSATAAKETSEMIENSIKTVERGTDLVTKTGDALSDIQNSSVKVSDIISDIRTSSNEQAQGISQINEGLTQIDTVTQTNTASAEESASAAEELSGQSNQLRELVDRFKLTGNSGNNLSVGYRSKPVISSSRKSLASRSFSPVREEDLYDMVDDSIRKDKISHQPKDIIRLDDDGFGRY